MPSRLSEVRQRFLREKNQAFIAAQPRLRLLRRRLLAIAGKEVVLRREPQLEELLARAEVWRRVCPLLLRGARNSCHENAARAFMKAPARHRIVTGWALHPDDVVWRQHTWVLRDDELCETTVAARVYYGVILDEREANSFAKAQVAQRE